MSRQKMKDLLAQLLTIFFYCVIQITWKVMEIVAYGKITQGFVDIIIGGVIAASIRLLMTGVVDRIEVQYLKCFFGELKKVVEKERANKV